MSNLCFPERILDQHLVILGKTGAGKSSALRHIVEYLLSRNKRVCIIDPKGDWWGLKSSSDGRSAGFPIIAFGDFKEVRATDVPINPHSGKHVAELIASGNRPCIIGFRGWMPGQMTDFWIDFASTLFNSSHGELYVVIDEVHNFAPKGKIMDPKAGKVLHWSNRLLSEGRGLGLVFLIASQRPQKVHNDTLTCCETLVAMRVNHAADRGAVKDWIDGCGDKAQGQEVLNSVAQMSRGEAFVWSPEIGFGPERVKFPFFKTFDSFAPPQLQKKVSQSGWSEIDLEAVKEKLATVIEETKANDPQELKRKIHELQQQLKRQTPIIDDKATERAVQQAVSSVERQYREQVLKLTSQISRMQTAFSAIKNQAGAFTDIDIPLAKIELPPSPQPMARNVVYTQPQRVIRPASGSGDESLSKAERSIMIVLAQYPDGRSKTQIAILAGYAHTSGSFRNSLSSLRTKGYLAGDNDATMRATDSGLAALGTYDPLPVGQELAEYWKGQLGKAERAIFEVVYESHPRAVSQQQVAVLTGYEATSGSFRNSISKLRTLELISGKGELKASDDLFD